jgi:hypothetical protein
MVGGYRYPMIEVFARHARHRAVVETLLGSFCPDGAHRSPNRWRYLAKPSKWKPAQCRMNSWRLVTGGIPVTLRRSTKVPAPVAKNDARVTDLYASGLYRI